MLSPASFAAAWSRFASSDLQPTLGLRMPLTQRSLLEVGAGRAANVGDGWRGRSSLYRNRRRRTAAPFRNQLKEYTLRYRLSPIPLDI